jgi:uncharacterized protein involved in outer membrane biogenesis
LDLGILKAAAYLALLLVAIVALVLVALFTIDLGRFKPQVEQVASALLERDFRVDGPLSATLDLREGLRLQLSQARLASTPWSAQPELLSLRSLALQLDLWSAFGAGPVIIDELTADGLRVYLEESEEGIGNWVLFPEREDDPDDGSEEQRFELPVLPHDILVTDSLLSFDSPRRPRPLELNLARIVEAVAANGELTMALEGGIREEGVHLEVSSANVDGLVDFRQVELSFIGKFGEIDFDGSLRIDDLLRPRRPTASLNLAGPSSEYLFYLLDVEPLARGPLHAELVMEPDGELMRVSIDSVFGDFTAKARGRYDDLTELRQLQLDFEAQAAEIGRLTRYFNIADVPSDPASLDGTLRFSDGHLTIDEVRMAVGESRLLLDGQLPDFPGPDGAELRGRLNVPDIGHYAGLFQLRGEVGGPLDVNLDVKPMEGGGGATLVGSATTNGLELAANGDLVASEGLVGTALSFAITGPGLGPITRALALQQGPQLPIDVQSSLRIVANGIDLQGVDITMGDNRLSLQGSIGLEPLQDGTDISLDIAGPDLSQLLASAGLPAADVPASPYQLAATLGSSRGRLELAKLDAQIGDQLEYSLQAAGLLTDTEAPQGSQLRLKASGPSLAGLLAASGIVAPAEPFEVDLKIIGIAAGYRLDQFVASVAGEQLRLSGLVASDPFAAATTVDVQFNSAALKRALAGYGVVVPQLPEGKFTTLGKLVGNGVSLRLENVVIDYIGTRARLEGDLGAFPELDGTDLTFDIRGQNLAWLLPAEQRYEGIDKRFSLTGGLALDDQVLSIDQAVFVLDNTSLKLHGHWGLDAEDTHGGVDLALHSPDIRPLLPPADRADMARVFPVDAQLSGDFRGDLWSVKKLDIRASDGHLVASGTLIGPPHFGDTNLSVNGNFVSLANFNRLLGQELPDLPATIELDLKGDGDRLRLKPMSLRIGESSLEGDLTIAEGDVPRIDGKFHSSRLDMGALLPEQAEPTPAEAEVAADPRQGPVAGKSTVKKSAEKVIPDTPIPMEVLQKFNAEIDIKVDELIYSPHIIRNVVLDTKVEAGAFGFKRFGLHTPRGGRLEGVLKLRPTPQGPQLGARLYGNELTIGLPAKDEKELKNLPHYDLSFAAKSTGATVRSMAAAADGYIRLEMGKGRLRAGAMRIFTNDFLSQLLYTLNPFSRDEPNTKVRCGMFLASVEEGQLEGKPIVVLRTDRIDISADAELDLVTEKVTATFKTTPRKGLGFSLSSLVNPYVMVAGTLAKPVLTLDPEGTLIEGGAAVATAGLSIVAKGLKDRFFSDKDPCGTAALEANKDQRALEKKFEEDPMIQ